MSHKGMDTIIKKDTNFDSSQPQNIQILIQIEQNKQLKRIADALDTINAEVDRKSRRIRPPGL